METVVTGGDNRQFRSIFSQYGQYREKIFRLLQERMRSQVATASAAAVGTLILIAGLGMLVLRPTLLTIAGLVKEIENEQKIIAILEDKHRALVTIQGFLEEVKDDLPMIDWAAPRDQELGIFAKEVEILAKEKELKVVEISQNGFNLRAREKRPDEEEFLQMMVSVGGSEEAVREFLAGLIKMDRLVIVKTVNIMSIPKEQRQDEPYQVKGSVMLEIMYYPEIKPEVS